ncbi:aspartic peptidase domain-containing protein [Globomyces pollinis-pini]|nr:aspartic peptidase domain-containing protein [Globomyces pollinis-pini]
MFGRELLTLIYASFILNTVTGQIVVPLSKRRWENQEKSLLERALTKNDLLFNLRDTFYVGKVTIGSGSEFELVFDTGSSDVWVRGSPCSNPIKDGSCEGKSLDTNDLSIKPISNVNAAIKYGSAGAFLNAFTGPVTFGSVKISSLSFGVASELNGTSAFDGIVGLGFPALSSLGAKSSQFRDTSNFIDAAINSLSIDSPNEVIPSKFGIYLANHEDFGSSEITIGGIDTSRFAGNIYQTPVASRKNEEPFIWDFSIKDFTVSAKGVLINIPLSINKFEYAVADSGTSLMYLHTTTANAINAAIGAVYNPAIDRYVLPNCTTIGRTDINFTDTSTGFVFSIPPQNYVFVDSTSKSPLCISGFMNTTHPTYAVFGAVFLRSYYSIYSKGKNPTISFAQAIHDKTVGLELLNLKIEQLKLKIQMERLQLEYLSTATPGPVETQIAKDLNLLDEYIASSSIIKSMPTVAPNSFWSGSESRQERKLTAGFPKVPT